MESRNGQFLVNFNTQLGPLLVVPSLDKAYDGVVLAQSNQAFMINVISKDLKSPFAAKLFIDSQEVEGNKTFMKAGNFFGFRRGGGAYDRFVFKIPEFIGDIGPSGKELKEVREKASTMGEIRIVFFKAFEKTKKMTNNHPRHTNRGLQDDHDHRGPSLETEKKGIKLKDVDFKSIPQSDSKCIQSRTLSVGIGDHFTIGKPQDRSPHKHHHSSSYDPQTNRRPDKPMVLTIGDYSEPIDQIIFRYSNPPTVIALGLMSPFNLSHWKYFPDWYLSKNWKMLSAMLGQLLLSQPKGLSKSQLVSLFQKDTSLQLQALLKPLSLEDALVKLKGIEVKGDRIFVNEEERIEKNEILALVLGGQQNQFCVSQEKPPNNYQRRMPKQGSLS